MTEDAPHYESRPTSMPPTDTHVEETLSVYTGNQLERWLGGRVTFCFSSREATLPHAVRIGGRDGDRLVSVRLVPEVFERMAARMRDLREAAGDRRAVCFAHGYRPAEEVVPGVGLVCRLCNDVDSPAVAGPDGEP